MVSSVSRAVTAAVLSLAAMAPAFAQAPPAPAAPAAAPQGRGNQPPPVVSQEVSADRHITFRIYAPQAQTVRMSAGDIPGANQAGPLTKGENGVWETTLGPVEPGAYRYSFNVDGVTVIDPREPVHERVEHSRLERGVRAGRREHRHAGSAARRGLRGDLLLDRAEDLPPHARLYAARLRERQRQVPGLLPPARRRGQRRLLDLRRSSRLHPRQPDCRQESQADARRHAGGHTRRAAPRLAASPAGRRRRTSSTTSLRTSCPTSRSTTAC